MAELCSYELLDMLLRGDGRGGSSGVHEKPSPTNLHYSPPPSSSALPTYYTAGNPSGKETASEAKMASWLCEVFQQEPRSGAATATTTNKSEGGDAAPSPSSSAAAGGHKRTAATDVAASGAAECRRGRSSGGRRRSCSGKATEQRRRDKINDKLKTLQQLLPWCSKVKTDKASTLEEVIKYVKSLQHQVQVMSANGCAIPMPILPVVGVMPPPCMQLPAGPVMLPRYPVSPMVYACPHHGMRPVPTPMPVPITRRHPAGSGSGGRQQLDPRPHLILTMPSDS